MSAVLSLEQLRVQFGSNAARGIEEQAVSSLSLAWPELDDALPDGGLPRGVIEIAAPRVLGGVTSIALAAVRAVHARDARAWCAWLDPEATLYAPGLVHAGVDLARLLVVRPPRDDLGKIAVKTVGSRAFDLVVIDMDPMFGTHVEPAAPRRARAKSSKKGWAPELLVRKLSLFADEGGTRVLLLTDANARRAMPWPVAMRLECTRDEDAIALRVAKDKRGRIGPVKAVPMQTRPNVHTRVA